MRLLLATFLSMLLIASSVPAETSGIEKGGTMIQGIIGNPKVLNPIIDTGYETLASISPVFDTLVTFDTRLTALPKLAKSWSISEDSKVYRFNLVENATWHDGVKFTSADVNFTFVDILLKRAARIRGALLKTFDRIDIPDDYTVIFRFKEPIAPSAFFGLLGRTGFGYIFPMHKYKGTDFVNNPTNLHPIGTGPFKFKEWSRGSHIILEKNPNYWKAGKPYLNRIITKFFSDQSSLLIAFERGEIDYIHGHYVPLSELQRLQKNPAIKLGLKGEETQPRMMTLLFNITKGPLKDLQVRRAIAHGIDKELLRSTVFFGQGKIATGPIPSAISWAYTKDVTIYEYNITKANALLDEAGYRRKADGHRFTLKFPYDTYGPFVAKTAEFVASQLEQMGIRVELRPEDSAANLERVYKRRDFDLNTYLFGLGSDPEIGVTRFFVSWNIVPVPFSNGAVGYRNAHIDSLFLKAKRIQDQQQRGAVYHEIQKILTAEIPYLWLIEHTDIAIFHSRVQNAHTWSGESRYEREDVWIKIVKEEENIFASPFAIAVYLTIALVAIAYIRHRKKSITSSKTNS